MFKDGFDSWQ